MAKTSKIVVSVTFLLWAVCLSAQEWVDTNQVVYRPVVAIKYSPLAFLSTTSAIQFGMEVKTFSNQSFQVEYGYVNDFKLFQEDYNGFKLKAEYRFYNPFKKIKPWNRFKKRAPNFFIGLQYFRKQVNAKGEASVNRSNGNYQEILPLTVRNITDAGFLVFGKVLHIGGRFFAESAFGIGGKNLLVTVQNLPGDGSLVGPITRGWFFDLTDGRGEVGSIDLFYSFKLIYTFQ